MMGSSKMKGGMTKMPSGKPNMGGKITGSMSMTMYTGNLHGTLSGFSMHGKGTKRK